jgi:hypothetical protein
MKEVNMAHESAKFARILRGLVTKTLTGELDWSAGKKKDQFVLNIGGNRLELGTFEDEFGEIAFELTIYNVAGQQTDSFSDLNIRGVYAKAYDENSYDVMRDLFSTLRRKGTGAEQTLDSILMEVEEDDDDIPF